MDCLRYRENPIVMTVLKRLEEDERLAVDVSLLDELNNYTVYSKKAKDISTARYRTREDLHTLAQPYETVQMYRGRVLRIKTGHLPVQRLLKRLWAVSTTALYENTELAKLTPVARKDAAMAAILEPLRERLDDCELVIETSTEVEKLLSNAYYTLKELRAINEAFLDEHRKDRNV